MNAYQIPSSFFGDTGFAFPKLGLGLAALGRPGYINLGHGSDLKYQYDIDEMERNVHEMLDEAYGMGIRYFDVAQSYGRSEKFIGNWLADKDPTINESVVGSKWGYTYVANWQVQATHHEIKEHSIEVLKRQWKFSSRTLDPFLKLYQIHSATFESKVLSNFKVLDYLFEIKSQGYMIGLTLSGEDQPELLSKALKISIEEEKLFDAVQLTYNLFERSCEQQIKEASEAGMAVIVKEALANGRLTERNTSVDFSKQLKVLDRIAKKYGTTYDVVALAFLNQVPEVSTILSGAVTKEQLLSNYQGLHLELSGEDIALLEEMKISPKLYWQNRKKMVWN